VHARSLVATAIDERAGEVLGALYDLDFALDPLDPASHSVWTVDGVRGRRLSATTHLDPSRAAIESTRAANNLEPANAAAER
jgi:hypothetical protein